MRSFDASTIAADLLPLETLGELQAKIGEFMVIGSVARDILAHGAAGLPLGRATDDLDIAVAIPSAEVYRNLLTPLGLPTGTAYRYRVHGVAVDVVPFGDLARSGFVEIDDNELDVSGLDEAYRTAITVTVNPGMTIRCPSLPALIALKLVAWHARHRYTNKDAKDLDLLLRATYCGPFEDDCWNDESSLENCDYDIFRVGPYRAGSQIRSIFERSTLERIEECLGGPLRGRLELDTAGNETMNRLAALEEGLRAGLT